MKNNILLAFLCFSFFLTFSSCDREGCTDPLSENFDALAIIDDGSCTYKISEVTSNIDEPTTLNGTVTVCGSIGIYSELTISEGTILNFCSDGALIVEEGGSITAIGSEDDRIIFQGEQSTEGFWGGLHIRSNSPSNKLDFVDILHAGNEWKFDYSAIYMNTNSRLSLTNSTIGKSSNTGLFAKTTSVITDFSNNTFTDNLIGMNIDASHMGILDEESSFNLNVTNDIVVRGGTISVPTTLAKTSGIIVITDWLEIEAAFTINPGAEILFRQDQGARVRVAGSITAAGLETDKINIGGEFDVANSWGGIRVESNNPNNIFEHVNIRFGGGYWGYDYSNIYVDGLLSLDKCEVTGANSYGLNVTSSGIIMSDGVAQTDPAGVLANNNFSGNGLVGDNACAPDCDIVFN